MIMDEPRIRAVDAIPGTQAVRVTWISGQEDIVDLSGTIPRFSVLHPLTEPKLFAAVEVIDYGWAIGWPGDIDYAADILWRDAREQASAAA